MTGPSTHLLAAPFVLTLGGGLTIWRQDHEQTATQLLRRPSERTVRLVGMTAEQEAEYGRRLAEQAAKDMAEWKRRSKLADRKIEPDTKKEAA